MFNRHLSPKSHTDFASFHDLRASEMDREYFDLRVAIEADSYAWRHKLIDISHGLCCVGLFRNMFCTNFDCQKSIGLSKIWRSSDDRVEAIYAEIHHQTNCVGLQTTHIWRSTSDDRSNPVIPIPKTLLKTKFTATDKFTCVWKRNLFWKPDGVCRVNGVILINDTIMSAKIRIYRFRDWLSGRTLLVDFSYRENPVT